MPNIDDSSEQTLICGTPSPAEQGVRGPIAAQLIVVEGAHLGRRAILDPPITHIGRRASNEFVLDSHTVSRDHAMIIREDDCYYVADVGSSNGVYVNGRKIPARQRHRLSHGDNLHLGDVLLLFVSLNRSATSHGFSKICIDQDKVQIEVDELFKRFLAISDLENSSPMA